MTIEGKLFDQCRILEMQPYVLTILLPDGVHECSGRIFGDKQTLTVRVHNTMRVKQTITLNLDHPQREYLSDKFFELAIKKYPRPLRTKENMARDEVFHRGTARRAKAWSR